MAARSTRLILVLAALWSGCQDGVVVSAVRRTAGPAKAGHYDRQPAPPQKPIARIVSLVPAVTEILFAVGAGSRVVGVSTFDAFPPEVRRLPRVGALIDPDTERILALRPDLVVTYGSQTDIQARFNRAGIRTFNYRHGGIAAVLDTIRDVGIVTGHTAEATRLVRDLQAHIDGVRMKMKGQPRPKTMIVFERQPKTLRNMYVSGGVGFLSEMLDAAGGANVFADVRRESVQPSQETLLMRAPEVILEVRAQGLLEPDDVQDEQRIWSTLASLPAVRNRRIHLLVGEHVVVPGPRLAQGIDAFARVLHPEVFRER
jgi:iron complex transport system substrate-binding protein